MNRKNRTLISVSVLLALLIGFPVWRISCNVHQARLDHALIEAIKVGNNQRTLALLAEGANGEARENDKPLTFQAALVHLLEHSGHPNSSPSEQLSDDKHLPALLLVYHTSRIVGRLDPKVIRALLDHGAHVNDRDAASRSPLFWAALDFNEDTVRLLLERGADVEAKGVNGETPIYRAHAAVKKILLERGANAEARDDYGSTPLHNAWEVGSVLILLKHGANIEARDNNGRTPLDEAARNEAERPASAVIRSLLEHGANIEARDKNGDTPLLQAAQAARPESIRLLLKHGANIEVSDNDGYTPLMWATSRQFDADPTRDTDSVRILLEHGAKVSTKDKSGSTALDIAVNLRSTLSTPKYRSRLTNLIALLCKYGAK